VTNVLTAGSVVVGQTEIQSNLIRIGNPGDYIFDNTAITNTLGTIKNIRSSNVSVYSINTIGEVNRGQLNGVYIPTEAESRTVAQGGTVAIGDVLRINRIEPDSPGYDRVYADYGPAINTGTSTFTALANIEGILNPVKWSRNATFFRGDIMPDADDTYFIGDKSLRWAGITTKNLTVNTSTIFFINDSGSNTSTFSVSGNKVTVNGGGFEAPGLTVTNLTIAGAVTGITTASIAGLSTVGYTGQYADLLGKPAAPASTAFDFGSILTPVSFTLDMGPIIV
jgi:hypothetical protein